MKETFFFFAMWQFCQAELDFRTAEKTKRN
jgi:hypothetical protein